MKYFITYLLTSSVAYAVQATDETLQLTNAALAVNNAALDQQNEFIAVAAMAVCVCLGYVAGQQR